MQKQRMACEVYEPNTKEGLYIRELPELELMKTEHTRMYNAYLTKEDTFKELKNVVLPQVVNGKVGIYGRNYFLEDIKNTLKHRVSRRFLLVFSKQLYL